MNIKLEQFLCQVRKEKHAHVFKLLEWYYHMIFGDSKENGETGEIYCLPEELMQPICERRSGIGEALKVLLKEGCDINEPDGGFNALMEAVGYNDEAMTAYLLKHGADVHFWPDMESGERNYYLDEIDVQYMDACFDNNDVWKDALLRTVMALVKNSDVRNYSGRCLMVDAEGNIAFRSARVMF